MPQVALELNFNAETLAAMCRSDEMPRHCPVEYGFICPFYPDNVCPDVTAEDWQAVCLAKENSEN